MREVTISLLQHVFSITKTVHKYTWASPDGSTWNQTDHYLISRRWRTSLLDLRGYRRGDVQSDHKHIDFRVQIKLLAPQESRSNLRKPYDTEKMHDDKVQREFCMTIKNKFNALVVEAGEPESIERKWDTVKSLYHIIA